MTQRELPNDPPFLTPDGIETQARAFAGACDDEQLQDAKMGFEQGAHYAQDYFERYVQPSLERLRGIEQRVKDTADGTLDWNVDGLDEIANWMLTGEHEPVKRRVQLENEPKCEYVYCAPGHERCFATKAEHEAHPEWGHTFFEKPNAPCAHAVERDPAFTVATKAIRDAVFDVTGDEDVARRVVKKLRGDGSFMYADPAMTQAIQQAESEQPK